MKLNDLPTQSGEWLSGNGPQHEIVVSSRVRLARNISNYPFLSKANRLQRTELHKMCRERLMHVTGARPAFYVDMEKTDEVDRQLLVERHLISKQHAAGEGSRGVSISNDEAVSVMVNEEDHMRLQVLRSGLQLREAWAEADKLDDALQESIDFAFSQRFGFLTACPTNLGTGLRVSVMMHLPGLKLTGEIEKIFRAAKEMHLAVRGLYGEGTEAIGDFYQISNQTTLGRSEEEILKEFAEQIIPNFISAELRERQVLESERPLALDDKIGRAIGVLKYARLLTSEETLFFLSHLRLGVVMKRVTGLDLAAINSLFLHTQPAHLQRMVGKPLDGDARKAARAEFVRAKLGKNNL
ncbi:MAG TPA: protein arginine kinase [Phycisphaerae bacterium]|jgi:protein arginine kinase|nr:protein arginine kinase [Phycisphaerae bacterium]